MAITDFLDREMKKDLLRFTLVGSVDDGKSTLIGRLLHDARGVYEDQIQSVQSATKKRGGTEDIDYALITDGLKAEREQGITIDVAYRYFATARRKFIIADTPGHEQYTRNMATGASTADLAIILLDAELGVLPQSKRHAFIASLLGIDHVLVAVNKMDLVDYSRDRFEEVRDEFSDFLAKLEVPDVTFMPISALVGDNVVEQSPRTPWYRGGTLLHFLETVHVAGGKNLIDMRFPIQYVIRPDARFRGYGGTLASGVLQVGKKVIAIPSGQTTTIKSIETFDGPLDEAFAPQAVTITLDDEIDLSRGDMLAYPKNQPHETTSLEAMLVWMSEEPVSEGFSCMVKQTTRTVKADLREITYVMDVTSLHRKDAGSMKLNDIGRVSLDLHRPLFVDPYRKNKYTGSFVLIDSRTNATLAAGMAIERKPDAWKPRRAKETKSSLTLITERGSVTTADREKLLDQKGAVVWFTGLSGSGKSTAAFELEKKLVEMGRPAYVLDGDNVRQGLCKDLDFSPRGRSENIRRVGEVAALMADAGLIVITSFISPYVEDRNGARRVAPDGRFVEVFVDTPIEVCRERDAKGLYEKAEKGIIPDFTGVSAPYEKPENPEITLDYDEKVSPAENAERIIDFLKKKKYLS